MGEKRPSETKMALATELGQPSVPLTSDQYTHVIALVHGIRDIAAWKDTVSDALKAPGVHVAQLRYGYYPAFRFMFPLNLSGTPVTKIIVQLQDLRREFKNAKISVIAHSFGTYVVLNALRKDHNLELWKLIFCGSVADDESNWSDIRHRIGDAERPAKDFIVNDCGTADSWPLLATGFCGRYGMAGVTGFSEVHVTNRFFRAAGDFPGHHSLYFDQEFVRSYWRPFLIDDHQALPGNGIQGEHIFGLVSLFYNPLLRWLGRFALFCVWILILFVVGWSAYEGMNYALDAYNSRSPTQLPLDFPLPPELLPSPSRQNEANFPTSAQIQEPNNGFSIKSVLFRYHSQVTRDLKLLLYDCESIQKGIDDNRVLEWPLRAATTTANQNFDLFSGFRVGSNWYGIYIFDLTSHKTTLIGYYDLTSNSDWQLTVNEHENKLHGILLGK